MVRGLDDVAAVTPAVVNQAGDTAVRCVRMTIVPAVMTRLDHAAWWLPRWLDRVLPDVDVEGEKLRTRLDEREARAVLGTVEHQPA